MDNPTTPKHMLEVRKVSIDYGAGKQRLRAVERVSLKAAPGECLVLTGRSGCGKSTILKAIAGFIPVSEGEIGVKGYKVTKPGPDRMVVWQDIDQLFPWKTIEENVAYPLLHEGKSRKEAMSIALEWLKTVGLERAVGQFPHQLSGGMKQRVAIARGFAASPALLLMDEPFSALDALSRTRLQDELMALQARTKTTVVFVSHDIEEAAKIASRVVVLSPHPGRVKTILQGGTPGLVLALRDGIFDESHGKIKTPVAEASTDHETDANMEQSA